MSTERDGKARVSLREAVEVIKSSRADVPGYVRVISEQNRAIREARREIPAVAVGKPDERRGAAEPEVTGLTIGSASIAVLQHGLR